VVLKAVRQNVRGLPVDVAQMNRYVELRGGPKDFLKTPFPAYIPNEILHPQQPNWLLQGRNLMFLSKLTCAESTRPCLSRQRVFGCVWEDHAGVPLPHLCSHGASEAQRSCEEVSLLLSPFSANDKQNKTKNFKTNK